MGVLDAGEASVPERKAVVADGDSCNSDEVAPGAGEVALKKVYVLDG